MEALRGKKPEESEEEGCIHRFGRLEEEEKKSQPKSATR
jgi:hypothetical protein